MAYTFQMAVVKPKGLNQRWVEIDIENETIQSLLNTYHYVYLVLHNPYLTGSHTFDLTQHRDLVVNFGWRVDEWLAYNGSESLPTTPGAPSITYKKARYKDAAQADYHIRKVHPTTHPDIWHPESDLTDLLMTKENIDYAYAQQHMLVSVNGYWHRTTHSANGLRIRNGAVSSEIANQTDVGILSTVNLGKCTYIPITPEMIYKLDPSHHLRTKAFINLGQEIENKTLLLCLGGYLHVVDGTYRDMGNNQVVIHLHKFFLMQRYIESKDFIDLSSITQHFINTDDNIDVDKVFSDAAIIDYLTLSQSFFVLVDTPTLITERKELEGTGLPGLFVHHSRPEDPLFFYSGKGASYWTQEQSGKWVITFKPATEPRYRFETSNWLSEELIDDSQDIATMGALARGYLLEIGKEILTT